jgi:hypothetical protein
MKLWVQRFGQWEIRYLIDREVDGLFSRLISRQTLKRLVQLR